MYICSAVASEICFARIGFADVKLSAAGIEPPSKMDELMLYPMAGEAPVAQLTAKLRCQIHC